MIMKKRDILRSEFRITLGGISHTATAPSSVDRDVWIAATLLVQQNNTNNRKQV